MCGRYNVTDSPEVRTLMERLMLPNTLPTPQLCIFRPIVTAHSV